MVRAHLVLWKGYFSRDVIVQKVGYTHGMVHADEIASWSENLNWALSMYN
jgi:hypothetical protein